MLLSSTLKINLFLQVNTMAEGGEGNKDRAPKDMTALLKFCLEKTKEEDPTQSSSFREMSPEVKSCFFLKVHVQSNFSFDIKKFRL